MYRIASTIVLVIIATVTVQATTKELTEVERYRLNLWANYNYLVGRDKQAESLFKQLIAGVKEPATLYGYLHYLNDKDDYEKIVELVPTIKRKNLFANDPAVHLMVAKAFEAVGQPLAAYTYITEKSDKFKDNQEIVYYAALAYHALDQTDAAIKLIKNLLASGKSTAPHLFYFLLSQLYLEKEDMQQALANIQKSIEVYPQFDKGWLLLSVLYEQQGKIQKAIEGYDTFLDLVGHNDLVAAQLRSLIVKSERAMDPHVSPRNAIVRYYYYKAFAHYQKREYDRALKAVEKALNVDPQALGVLLLKIDVLIALERYQEAWQLLKEQVLNSKEQHVWLQAVHALLAAHPQNEDLFKVIVEAAYENPKNAEIVLCAADSALRAQKNNYARYFLKKAYALTTDPKVRAKICFQLGLLYYQNHSFIKMRPLLLKAIEYDPQFAPAYNLLSYYYATKGKQLEKAEELIKTALKIEPGNNHYKDTQAWIYYKMRDYTKATEIIATIPDLDDKLIRAHKAKIAKRALLTK